MPEYQFISVPLVRKREGTEPEHDYRTVIREQAAQGWAFVQAIVFDQAPNPHLDLVFSRKAARS